MYNAFVYESGQPVFIASIAMYDARFADYCWLICGYQLFQCQQSNDVTSCDTGRNSKTQTHICRQLNEHIRNDFNVMYTSQSPSNMDDRWIRKA